MERHVVKAFLSLICLGIETKSANNYIIESYCLTQKEWIAIRALADRQGVSAIVFDGLNHIINKFGTDAIIANFDKAWWQSFVFDWMGVMLQTEQRNKRQSEVIEELASQWASKGCRVMVMKGQASATYYPKPNHRNPGDIDCYLFDDYNLGNSISREMGAIVDESWYKHSSIYYHGETFENHRFFVSTREGRRGKILQKNWKMH